MKENGFEVESGLATQDVDFYNPAAGSDDDRGSEPENDERMEAESEHHDEEAGFADTEARNENFGRQFDNNSKTRQESDDGARQNARHAARLDTRQDARHEDNSFARQDASHDAPRDPRPDPDSNARHDHNSGARHGDNVDARRDEYNLEVSRKRLDDACRKYTKDDHGEHNNDADRQHTHNAAREFLDGGGYEYTNTSGGGFGTVGREDSYNVSRDSNTDGTDRRLNTNAGRGHNLRAVNTNGDRGLNTFRRLTIDPSRERSETVNRGSSSATLGFRRGPNNNTRHGFNNDAGRGVDNAGRKFGGGFDGGFGNGGGGFNTNASRERTYNNEEADEQQEINMLEVFTAEQRPLVEQLRKEHMRIAAAPADQRAALFQHLNTHFSPEMAQVAELMEAISFQKAANKSEA